MLYIRHSVPHKSAITRERLQPPLGSFVKFRSINPFLARVEIWLLVSTWAELRADLLILYNATINEEYDPFNTKSLMALSRHKLSGPYNLDPSNENLDSVMHDLEVKIH